MSTTTTTSNGTAAAAAGLSLPLELPPETKELQQRARTFIEEHVIPLEQEAERLYGRLPQEKIDAVKQAGIDAGLNGGQHSPEYGGQGWSTLDWVVVEEQYGRSTNGIYWHVPNAYNVFHNASEAQAEKYLRPLIAGKMKDAYAVTEAEAGSDPSGTATTAERTDSGYRINGEKWFVTSGDIADVLIVMANVIDGDERLPTLFLVDIDAQGVEIVDDPQFTHHYPEGHPTIRFTNVEVGEDAVVQGVGEGEEMQRAWFLEERLGIAARGVGAMWRLLDESVEWATNRVQGGNRIYDYQGVSFPLADSAADAAAGRLLTYQVAVLADGGEDLKLVHGKASMAKLFVSEAACRCADRAVQALGGRGYMRQYTAERLLRELRVDRIWEGTSEIQRLVVARGLERRGVERMLH
jgi:acyl-CoA dehydrogenase